MTTLLAGLGFKPQHFSEAQACTLNGLWFEVHAENYMVAGGMRLAQLDAIAAQHPLSLHGVGLSLAADTPPDAAHLKRLAELVARYQPALVSEHLAWSQWQGIYHPDLLPVTRNAARLQRLADNIDITQNALGRTIAIENPSHYLALPHDIDEPTFLAELQQRTACTLLLDVNNIFVSAHNLQCDAQNLLSQYLNVLPPNAISEIHLAGHEADAKTNLLIDGHNAEIAERVWALYEMCIQRLGARPTLIERDDNLPEFSVLLAEAQRAQQILQAA
jgi:uncharacterized protein (UPF0276 family)